MTMNDEINQCKGCPRFRLYYIESLQRKQKECGFTNYGVRYVANCPCWECLLKVMCTTLCDSFFHYVDLSNSPCISSPYSTTLVIERKQQS